MRNIVLHYHIFKNAGSTVRSILENNFAGLCGDVEGINPWDTIESDRILQYAFDHPDLQVISTHHGRPPVPVNRNITFHPVIFLRHPIDRAGSVYSFEHRQAMDSPSLGVKIAIAQDLAGYVRWRLTERNGAVIKNFHTVVLAGREKDMRTATASYRDLEIAKEWLKGIPFFGLVESFDTSLSRMRSYLAQYFGDINPSFIIQNSSPDRKDTMQDRLQEIEEMLGHDLYKELVDKNALDMELYNFARELFDQEPK